jgi:hypothetical protein
MSPRVHWTELFLNVQPFVLGAGDLLFMYLLSSTASTLLIVSRGEEKLYNCRYMQSIETLN